MKHRSLKSLFAVTVLLLVLVFGLSACSDDSRARPGRRVVPVKTGEVTVQDVPLQVKAIGTVEAYNTVSVKALVGGEVTAVYFKEGQDVKEGNRLFQIDPRPYEAALKQAEAQLARDMAQAKNAEDQAKRYEILVQKDYVSKDQYDQIRANADALSAAVKADQAAAENGRLQLSYCTIKSPIDGRAGTILINKGNVIKANDLVMVTINKISPIYVTFSIPEQNLPEIKKYQARAPLKVEALIPGQESRNAPGKLTFINNTVDAATGMIQLKGTFANRNKHLWPGQFVNVILTLTTQRKAVVMPTAALQAGQQGQYVFVVKPDFTVESRPVVVARSFGDLSVVAEGVREGETVVTDGQVNLMPGARVEVKGEPPENGPPPKSQVSNTNNR